MPRGVSHRVAVKWSRFYSRFVRGSRRSRKPSPIRSNAITRLAAARSLARREVALYLAVVAKLDPTVRLEPVLVSRLQQLAAHHKYEEAGNLISDGMLDRFAFSGSPRCHHCTGIVII
jgi:hypothetical protein